MLTQGGIKVIHCLHSSGTNSDEGCGVVQWQWLNRNGIRLMLNLGCEELHMMCHLFYTMDFADKRLLKGSHSS